MTKFASVLFLYAETPIHAGVSGGPGFVDNQIQRDPTTKLPVIHSSGIKGVIHDQLAGPVADRVLGTPRQAGRLLFSDARLLLLPVPSLAGVFAWVTCPLAIQRLERDMQLFGVAVPAPVAALRKRSGTVSGMNALVGSSTSPVLVTRSPDRVVLDDFCFEAVACPELVSFARWIGAKAFPKRSGRHAAATTAWGARIGRPGSDDSALVLVSDEAFRDLAEFCLTIVERNKVEEGKDTVPWTEEHLPAESLMYAMLSGLGKGQQADVDEITDCLTKRPVLHVGGTASLGRGLLSARIHPKPAPRRRAGNGHVPA